MLFTCVRHAKVLHSCTVACDTQTSYVSSAAAVSQSFLVGLHSERMRWRNKTNKVSCFYWIDDYLLRTSLGLMLVLDFHSGYRSLPDDLK